MEADRIHSLFFCLRFFCLVPETMIKTDGAEDQIAFVRRDVRIGADIRRVEIVLPFDLLIFSVD